MRNLGEIIEDCKLNKKPTVDELRYAVIALTYLTNMMESSLLEIYEKTENTFIKIRVKNIDNAYSTALNKSPKEWIGWNTDPENPEYQKFHALGSKLVEKAMRGELPNQKNRKE